MNAGVQSLPPEQFAINGAKAALTLIDMWMEAAVARYGRGNFRWVTMVGDLSAMYDEIDPALACEMAQEANGNLPRWTGGRRRDYVNMTSAGGQVQWGKANRDSRLTVDLEQLMQMVRFDCESTLYKFRGKVNRRKFGVPMGGFMSPGLAVIALSMVETNMEPGPDLISGMVRYIDDVLGLYAVCTGTEDEQVNECFERVALSYPPPLVLNVEAKSNTLRFLELVITIDADRLSCRLWNSVARNTGSGDTVLTRLPMLKGGTSDEPIDFGIGQTPVDINLIIAHVERTMSGAAGPMKEKPDVDEGTLYNVGCHVSNKTAYEEEEQVAADSLARKAWNKRMMQSRATTMTMYLLRQVRLRVWTRTAVRRATPTRHRGRMRRTKLMNSLLRKPSKILLRNLLRKPSQIRCSL